MPKKAKTTKKSADSDSVKKAAEKEAQAAAETATTETVKTAA